MTMDIIVIIGLFVFWAGIAIIAIGQCRRKADQKSAYAEECLKKAKNLLDSAQKHNDRAREYFESVRTQLDDTSDYVSYLQGRVERFHKGFLELSNYAREMLRYVPEDLAKQVVAFMHDYVNGTEKQNKEEEK